MNNKKIPYSELNINQKINYKNNLLWSYGDYAKMCKKTIFKSLLNPCYLVGFRTVHYPEHKAIHMKNFTKKLLIFIKKKTKPNQ